MPNRASELRERVRRMPGMERLLPALEGLPPAYLVGGGVRDLQSARAMLEAGADRIGASVGVKIVQESQGLAAKAPASSAPTNY